MLFISSMYKNHNRRDKDKWVKIRRRVRSGRLPKATLSSKCNWLCGKWLTLTMLSERRRNRSRSPAMLIWLPHKSRLISVSAPLTWVDLKFCHHNSMKYSNGIQSPRPNTHSSICSRVRFQIPVSQPRIHPDTQSPDTAQGPKDGRHRLALLSAVANVNWAFGQNRAGNRLHFNFPLPLLQERLANSLALL